MSTFSRVEKHSASAGHGRHKDAARPPHARAEATPERIRTRAYEIFQERSGRGAAGDALSDWLQAERELRLER